MKWSWPAASRDRMLAPSSSSFSRQATYCSCNKNKLSAASGSAAATNKSAVSSFSRQAMCRSFNKQLSCQQLLQTGHMPQLQQTTQLSAASPDRPHAAASTNKSAFSSFRCRSCNKHISCQQCCGAGAALFGWSRSWSHEKRGGSGSSSSAQAPALTPCLKKRDKQNC